MRLKITNLLSPCPPQVCQCPTAATECLDLHPSKSVTPQTHARHGMSLSQPQSDTKTVFPDFNKPIISIPLKIYSQNQGKN